MGWLPCKPFLQGIKRLMWLWQNKTSHWVGKLNIRFTYVLAKEHRLGMGFGNLLVRKFGFCRQLVIITGQADLRQQVDGQHLAWLLHWPNSVAMCILRLSGLGVRS